MLGFFLESCLVDHLLKLVDQTVVLSGLFHPPCFGHLSMDLLAPFQLVDLWPFPPISSLYTLERFLYPFPTLVPSHFVGEIGPLLVLFCLLWGLS